MKRLLIILLAFISCRKDKPFIQNECVSAKYDLYSTQEYDFIKKTLIGTSPLGSSYYAFEKYSYKSPVFNKANKFEIVFIKQNNQSTNLEKEIWSFNFCTGLIKKLVDNFNYNLDLSAKGWLLYTDINHNISKIKSNGDSLSVLSTLPGYNRAGKWNPTGSLYWNNRDDGLHIENDKGNVVKIISTIPFDAKDWLNDSTLIGLGTGSSFFSLNIYNEELTQLNNNWTSSNAPVIFDFDNMNCYVPTLFNNSFLMYDLSGTNNIDSLSDIYNSYNYGNGDYLDGKIITSLVRMHWKDKDTDQIYYRANLLIMDTDGTNERLIKLP